MAVTITIATADRTNEVEKFSPNLSQTLSKGPATFSFSMKGAKTFPALGSAVVMSIDGTPEFTGTIVEMHAQSMGGVMVGYDYVCLDGYYALDGKLISKAYTAMDAVDIVDDILTLSGSGITLDAPATSPTISTARFNYEQASQCIQKIANQIGWDWYIDASNVLHFFPPESTPAPFAVEDNNDKIVANSLSFDSNITELKNVVYVRGGEYLDPIAEGDAVDVYTADGAQDAFPLVLRYSNVQVKLDGVAQTVGVDYLDEETAFDCRYNYQEKAVKFPVGTLAGGEVLKVWGDAHVPLIVQAVDSDSVAAYGEREGIEIDKTIDSIQEAELLANSILDKWRAGSKSGSFQTRETGLRIGQTITVNSARFGVNASYRVNRISGVMRHHDEFQYTVEFITSGQTTLTDMLIDLIGRDRKNITISPDEVIQKFRKLEDSFSLSDEIVSVTTTSPPYYVGSTAVVGFFTMG